MSDPVLAEIAVVPGATDYTTPSAYFAGTLYLYINGLLTQRAGTEGLIELGGNAFRLHEGLRTGDTLHAYYQERGQTPSPYPEPPLLYQTLNLVPIPAAANDLHPIGCGTVVTGGAATATPTGWSSLDLAPAGADVVDLVPTPLSAKEV
jgi:hypothetical protein